MYVVERMRMYVHHVCVVVNTVCEIYAYQSVPYLPHLPDPPHGHSCLVHLVPVPSHETKRYLPPTAKVGRGRSTLRLRSTPSTDLGTPQQEQGVYAHYWTSVVTAEGGGGCDWWVGGGEVGGGGGRYQNAKLGEATGLQ